MKDNQLSGREQFNEYLKKKENFDNKYKNINNENIITNNSKLTKFSNNYENFDFGIKEKHNPYFEKNVNNSNNLINYDDENLDVNNYEDNFEDLKKYKNYTNLDMNMNNEYELEKDNNSEEILHENSENFEENSIEYIENYAEKNRIEMEDLEIYKDKFLHIKSPPKNIMKINSKKFGKEHVILNKKIKLFEDKNLKKKQSNINATNVTNIRNVTRINSNFKNKTTNLGVKRIVKTAIPIKVNSNLKKESNESKNFFKLIICIICKKMKIMSIILL